MVFYSTQQEAFEDNLARRILDGREYDEIPLAA
jgi:hypothetical protein